MKPGRFEEQPMPLMTMTSCGWSPSSASANCNDASTLKSPQPGHQSGSIFPLKSLAVGRAPGDLTSGVAVEVRVSVGIMISLHNVFVDGHVNFRGADQDLLHSVDYVMRHKRFAVVFADVAGRDEAGFGAEVARELSTVVVLHDNGRLALRQDRQDLVRVQRHEPFDLQVVGHDAFFAREVLARFTDDALG